MSFLSPLPRLRAFSRTLSHAVSSPPRYVGPSFAFDIDGVLLRGRTPLPPARPTMSLLYDPLTKAWRHPVAFLTNGGGHTETHRAGLLSDLLGVPVSPDQVVLAHTPMREHARRYQQMPAKVVVVGPPGCVEAARAYGFPHVITTERLARVDARATPFARLAQLPEASAEERELARMRTAAVFVMADSRDWGRDIQLLVDILGSDGSARRVQSDEQVVDLFYCNPDITFPTEFHLPRLAGGSFGVALEAVFARVTGGRRLRVTQFGKPHAANYQLAEAVLRAQTKQMGFCGESDSSPIYAVGDNPLSDVRGANARKGPWVSVLVRTGNFSGADNDPHDPAHIVLDDAHAAVQYALRHPTRRVHTRSHAIHESLTP